MPRIDPMEFESLALAATRLVREHALHDVWRVDLAGGGECTIPDMVRLLTSGHLRSVPWTVRLLFTIRRVLGAILGLDGRPGDVPRFDWSGIVPPELATPSLVPPGTPAGPFRTLFMFSDEAAYAAVNATVDARLVVAVRPSTAGHRLYWATYLRPVGRITGVYMRLIDPFRRWLVYPGLERWIEREYREESSS